MYGLLSSSPLKLFSVIYGLCWKIPASCHWFVKFVGTPTCHSISSYSISFHLTALLPLSLPQSPHTDLVNSSLTTTANHCLGPSFSVYFHEQRKRPGQAKPSQAKPIQNVKWGAETCVKRKSTSPCQLAIPAFDRIARLSNRHLNSNRGICWR